MAPVLTGHSSAGPTRVDFTVDASGSITIVAAWKPSKRCSFCEKLGVTGHVAKHGWDVCYSDACTAAQTAHAERMYAGLVDCPETRRSALEWVTRAAR